MEETDIGSPAVLPERHSFYGVIKNLAKLPPEEGCEALRRELREGRPVEELSSKGSTALHACAYLQRWDLAKILMEAGASPTAKNHSGHSFFMTMVRFAGAPWRELLESHPELVAKHERFLSKRAGAGEGGANPPGPTSAGKKRRERKAHEAPLAGTAIDAGGERASGPQQEAATEVGSEAPAIAFASCIEELTDALDAEFEGQPISGKELFALAQSSLSQKQWDRLALALRALGPRASARCGERSLAQMAVSLLSREELVEALGAGLPTQGRGADGSNALHEAVKANKADLVQLLLLNQVEMEGKDSFGRSPLSLAVESGNEDMVERLLAFGARARGRMSASDARSYKQYAEDRGLLEMADMISSELECQPKGASGLRAELSGNASQKRHGAGQKGWGNGRGKRAQEGSLGALNANGGAQRASRSSGQRKNGAGRKGPHLIANLDRPIREASDYSFPEPKALPDGKQPLIIIKRSRLPRPGGPGGAGGAGAAS